MRGKGGKADGRNSGVTIIRKEEVIEVAHHGGAWKVAYADFVTAMMAFFLLMWLLNATTEDQRKGLADYFSPNNLLSRSSSGTGDPFGGHTAFDKGGLVSDRGSAQVITGLRPLVEQTKDGDDPVLTDYHRAKSGDGVGAGPMAEDQDADDATDDKPLGQTATRPAPGPGGSSVVRRDGEPTLRSPAAAELAAATERQQKAAFEQAAQQIKDAVRS